jgi:hypothetical protein
MNFNDEVGKRLNAADLKPESVVWVRRADRQTYATLWVERVWDDAVMFLAGATTPKLHLLAERRRDNVLVDDTGTELEVYEYKGEI